MQDGKQIIKETVPPNKLEDYVGKEVAERLMSAKPNNQGYRVLEGDDLRVGGHGMKGFYDKILPAEVNKFFNKAKWGKAAGNLADPAKPQPPTTLCGPASHRLTAEVAEYHIMAFYQDLLAPRTSPQQQQPEGGALRQRSRPTMSRKRKPPCPRWGPW